jgi:site-specific recombinase XerC
MLVAASPQTIKQHLAAIKMLFDYLVISQIVPTNLAAPVKAPTPRRQTRQDAGLKR